MKRLVAILILALAAQEATAAAYTFRAAGAIDYDTNAGTLTPGAPAGKSVGDLLILTTAQRVTAQTVSAITGWTEIYNQNAAGNSLYVFCRIADGTATDTPSVVWTGTTADMAARIFAFHGEVYTDCATILAHTAAFENTNQASDLNVPSLTVTTDNTMLLAFSVRQKTTTSDDATAITAPANFTNRGTHIQNGNNAMMLAVATWQQTTATSHGGANFTRDGTGESQPSSGVLLSLKTQAAPTFDAGLVETADTTSSLTFSYDASADADNIFSGLYRRGASDPTCAQVEAGTNAHGTATEATTGSADSITITTDDADPQAAYDAQACVENEGGYSALDSEDNVVMEAPAGDTYFEFNVPPPGGAISLVDDVSPAIVDGDYAHAKLTVDCFIHGEDAHTITFDADGTFSIDVAVDHAITLLVFDWRFQDVSAGAWSNATKQLFGINNDPQTFVDLNPSSYPDGWLLPVDETNEFDLADLWSHPYGRDMTFNINSLPSGMTEDGEVITAAPDTCGVSTADFEATDDLGQFVDEDVEITIGARIPDVTDNDEATAVAAIEALCSLTAVAGATIPSDTIAEGNVVSTTPDIGEVVGPTASVTYHLSSGDSTWIMPDCDDLSVTACVELILDVAPWRDNGSGEDDNFEVDGYVCGTGQSFQHVAAQVPAADAEVEDPDEPITVSLVGAVIPNLAGMTAGEAQDAIADICP